MNNKIERVHITDINAGDTILIDGKMNTICQSNIKSNFYGTSIKGEYFRETGKIVERVLFKKWLGNNYAWKAQL